MKHLYITCNKSSQTDNHNLRKNVATNKKYIMRILDCLKTFETTIWCFKQNSLNSMIKVNPLELQYVRGQ